MYWRRLFSIRNYPRWYQYVFLVRLSPPYWRWVIIEALSLCSSVVSADWLECTGFFSPPLFCRWRRSRLGARGFICRGEATGSYRPEGMFMMLQEAYRRAVVVVPCMMDVVDIAPLRVSALIDGGVSSDSSLRRTADESEFKESYDEVMVLWATSLKSVALVARWHEGAVMTLSIFELFSIRPSTKSSFSGFR